MAQPALPNPSGTTNTKVKDPIGVPGGVYQNPDGSFYYSGYTAQVPGQAIPLGYADPFNRTAGSTGTSYTPTLPTPPKYFDGDQWSPANLSVDDMIQLQQGLTAAGLYTGDYTLGVWGMNDVSAYERLLAMANAAGTDDKTMLTRAVAGAKSKPTRAPLVVKLTNPDDLKATLKNVAQNLYGGDLPDEDKQRFVDSYNAMESQAQQQAYNLGDPSLTGTLTGSGGSVYKPPDPQVAAEAQIRAEHPDQVEVTAFGSHFNDILKTLTSTPAGA